MKTANSIRSLAVQMASSMAPLVLPAYSSRCFARHARSTSLSALRQSLMIKSGVGIFGVFGCSCCCVPRCDPTQEHTCELGVDKELSATSSSKLKPLSLSKQV